MLYYIYYCNTTVKIVVCNVLSFLPFRLYLHLRYWKHNEQGGSPEDITRRWTGTGYSRDRAVPRSAGLERGSQPRLSHCGTLEAIYFLFGVIEFLNFFTPIAEASSQKPSSQIVIDITKLNIYNLWWKSFVFSIKEKSLPNFLKNCIKFKLYKKSLL